MGAGPVSALVFGANKRLPHFIGISPTERKKGP